MRTKELMWSYCHPGHWLPLPDLLPVSAFTWDPSCTFHWRITLRISKDSWLVKPIELSRGTNVARPWHERGTNVARPWHNRGTTVLTFLRSAPWRVQGNSLHSWKAAEWKARNTGIHGLKPRFITEIFWFWIWNIWIINFSLLKWVLDWWKWIKMINMTRYEKIRH